MGQYWAEIHTRSRQRLPLHPRTRPQVSEDYTPAFPSKDYRWNKNQGIKFQSKMPQFTSPGYTPTGNPWVWDPSLGIKFQKARQLPSSSPIYKSAGYTPTGSQPYTPNSQGYAADLDTPLGGHHPARTPVGDSKTKGKGKGKGKAPAKVYKRSRPSKSQLEGILKKNFEKGEKHLRFAD